MDAERIVRRTLAGLLLLVGGLGVMVALPHPNPPNILVGLLSVASTVVAAFGAYLMLTRAMEVTPVRAPSGLHRHLPLPLTGRWLRWFVGGSAAAAILIGVAVLAFPGLLPPIWLSGFIYFGCGFGALAALLVAAGMIAGSPPRK